MAEEDFLDVPVLRLLGQRFAPLDQQDAGAAVAQRVSQRAAAGPAADDDDVERGLHA
jgi:hypothetical protein